MKKEKISPANHNEGIANGASKELTKTFKLFVLLDDNTIEDSDPREIDSMLKEYGYN